MLPYQCSGCLGLQGTRVGVVYAELSLGQVRLSVAVRALTRAPVAGKLLAPAQEVLGAQISKIIATIDCARAPQAACSTQLLSRVFQPAGSMLDQWSRGLQSNSEAAKTGVGELDAIVRVHLFCQPECTFLTRPHGRYTVEAITRLLADSAIDPILLLSKFHARTIGALAVQ